MPHIPQPWRGRYGVALLMVTIGTIGVGACMALIAQPMFVLYIMPLAKAPCLGGLGSGLAAAALALLASTYLFLPPYFSLTSDHSLLPLVVCYLGTVVISALRASRSRASPHQG
jgi:K+-sensing histidine kinase KdpD